jgi:hypothetical protein
VRLAEAIMKDILSSPYFSSEPGLVMAFINYSPAFNRVRAHLSVSLFRPTPSHW